MKDLVLSLMAAFGFDPHVYVGKVKQQRTVQSPNLEIQNVAEDKRRRKRERNLRISLTANRD